MALTYTETEVVSETERYIVNPDIPVWALLPAYIFLKQGITGVAYPSYFDQLAFIGSSGLAIISHPAFHLAFPGLSPFKKFQPSSDIDLLIGSRYQTNTDTYLALNPFGFLHRFPSPQTSVANPDRWVAQTTLPHHPSVISVSICDLSTLGLETCEQWALHEPISYLPFLTIDREPYTERCEHRGRESLPRARVQLVWAAGGISDLKYRTIRIPDPDTFLNTQPPLDTLTRLLIFAKYAACMPEGTIAPTSLAAARAIVAELTPNFSPENLAHLAKRTLDMVNGLIKALPNSPHAIGNFITTLSLLNIPHQPEIITAHAKQIQPQIEPIQQLLAADNLQLFADNPDPTRYIDPDYPVQYLIR